MITVKVSDLLDKTKELSADGCKYVDSEEIEAEDDSPKCLHFDAYDGEGGGIDYEDIENVDVSAFYKSL